MSLSDLVNVTFVLQNPGVTAAGFGVPLIASPNATWAERTRTYTSITGVAADWGAGTPEYLAAQKMFSQSTGLTSLMIGRCSNKPTQKWSVSVANATVNAIYKLRIAANNNNVWTSQECDYTAVASVAWQINTAYSQGAFVTNSGNLYVCITSGTSAGAGGPTTTASDITDNTVHWMYLGAGAAGVTTNDVIVYNLMILAQALAAPAINAAISLQGSVGSKTLQLLANNAGDYFALEALDLNYLATSQTHADPGIASDLDAIKAASSAWYGLVTLYNSSAIIAAAAAWVESNSKLYTPSSADSLVATQALGIGSDIAQTLKSAAYARTGLFFHPAADEHAGAVEMARWFPIDPGADDWRLKTLAGVTEKTYTDTWVTNLEAKYCNFYADLQGDPLVQGDGKVAANEYIDVIRFRDWYVARLQERCANALIQAEKIPFTDAGIAIFVAIIKALNSEGVRVGGIAPDGPGTPITVTAPKVADITSDLKQQRWLQGVTTTWTLTGAIHKLSVTVQASA